MLNKIFLPACRNILKQGWQSLISMAGLSTALACSILILLYIKFELSYDHFHENADNIYRVLTKQAPEFSYKGNTLFAATPGPLKNTLITEVPLVKNATKCILKTHTLEYNNSLFLEPRFLYADSDFLKIFSFPIISGNPEDLNEPFTLFMTETMVTKYFGNEDPSGRVIRIDNKHSFTVRGIMADAPVNSHFSFDFLTGFPTFYSMNGGRQRNESWGNFNYMTYLELQYNSAPENIVKNLDDLPARYLQDIQIFKGMHWILQPLKKIHLGGNANFEPARNSDMRYIYLTGSIGIFILIIACFNCMNMASARAFSRGREIGIKKVAGSSRADLIMQLLAESVLLSFGGFLIAMIIVPLILPIFAGFTERPFTFNMIFEPVFLAELIVLCLFTGIIAGIIPALKLSSYKPVNLIREEYGDTGGNKKRNFTRNTFVIIQYFISIVAIISAFMILRQLNFIKKSDSGFTGTDILNISLRDPALRKNPGILLDEFRKNPVITGTSISTDPPYSINSAGLGEWEGKPAETNLTVYRIGIDSRFMDLYKIKLVSGRGFSDEYADGSLNNCIINQTAAKMIGWEDPVGKKFGLEPDRMGTVIGVVKDFNFQPLTLPVESLVLFPVPSAEYTQANMVSVSYYPVNLPEALDFINKTLKEISPAYINPVSMVSDKMEAMYISDRRLSEIIIFATIITVILTCLGQYGLSYFSAKKRIKEMAVRKVHGATPFIIMSLMNGEAIRLVLISTVLAVPVSFIILNKWLQKFAYRISFQSSAVLFSVVIILLITILVVFVHVYRLSRVNPAETIRYE